MSARTRSGDSARVRAAPRIHTSGTIAHGRDLQVKENETEDERRIRLEMEALAADEAERRAQVSAAAQGAAANGAAESRMPPHHR